MLKYLVLFHAQCKLNIYLGLHFSIRYMSFCMYNVLSIYFQVCTFQKTLTNCMHVDLNIFFYFYVVFNQNIWWIKYRLWFTCNHVNATFKENSKIGIRSMTYSGNYSHQHFNSNVCCLKLYLNWWVFLKETLINRLLSFYSNNILYVIHSSL